MNNKMPTYYFPDGLGLIMLLALEEVMGKSGLNALLNLSSLSYLIDNYPSVNSEKAIPFETISKLQNALRKAYGPHGGHGLALRAGRVFFSNGLRIYGPGLGLNDTNFRLQPPDLKLLDVLTSLTDFFNQYTDQQVILEQTRKRYLWNIRHCPWCWGHKESEPVCHFAVGMLQEALYWVSGGKFYNVIEETCIAQGDSACLIVIDRVPLT
jgi:predicted hydrocarbon binding protein